MLQYLIKRIFLFIPTLFFITVISFGISRLAPGDPAAAKAGVGAEGGMSSQTNISEKTVELIRKQWRLNLPIHEQYWEWVKDLATFNFGNSFLDSRPVADKILERVPVTIGMNLLSILIAYGIAIPLGVYSATHQGSLGDRVSTFFVFALYSLPTFWIGTMAITYFCNPEYFAVFPTGGLRSINFSESWPLMRKLGDYMLHLTLPMLVYTYGSFAFISRQMRSGMLEVVRQDYVRTARAKGLNERTVIWKHALRNSLIPIITLLAGLLPNLIGGSVIVETIFSVPGMGELSFKSLVARDYPTIMAVFTLSAVLTLIGILLSDLLYSVVDPRIAYQKRSS
jgi:peptide/nickel transport system permease protein